MIFVDTGAWVAIENGRDPFHEDALRVLGRAGRGEFGGLTTSDYVLDESLTLLRLEAGLEAAESLADRVFGEDEVQVLWTGKETFQAALGLLRERRDKRWSLTDCVSFVHMRAVGITKAFAFDRHFTQAGFEVVPLRGR